MHTLSVRLFTDAESDPLYGTYPDVDYLGVQVDLVDELGRKDVYDFRLKSPVRDHLLGEVTQLIADLLSGSCQKLGGLQPALF